MFRTFAQIPNVGVDRLFLLHPYDHVGLLEKAWEQRAQQAVELGNPLNRSDSPSLAQSWLAASLFADPPKNPTTTLVNDRLNAVKTTVIWKHLIYAYMVENTRVVDIMRRVVNLFVHGEKLGTPSTQTPPGLSSASRAWLRSTEELFFREGAPFFVTTVTSRLRADQGALGRAVYYRLLGMDLNHGTEDNAPYTYTKAEAANTSFVGTFEELLREVWIGIENVNNGVGPNPTDDAKILDLVKRLRDMLISRREGGNLSREEFSLVSMMEWFHLTLESDTFIVQDLRAQGASAEERLFSIAQRVGLPAHGLSRNYLSIADSVSLLLLLVELNLFNSTAQVPALYTLPNPLAVLLATIIRDWSTIAGRDLKARKVVSA